MAVNDRVNRWYRVHRAEEVKKRGGRCLFCGSMERLEFAHVKRTPLSGMSRGRPASRVFRDLKLNPASYILLCSRCHHAYDGKENFALEKFTR